MTHHFSCSGREKNQKNILGPKKVQKGPKRVILGQNFQKNENFSKIFFFNLNDSESKKGQKTMNFFSLLDWSDTSFLAKKMRILDVGEF